MRSRNSRPIDEIESAYMADVKRCSARNCERPVIARGLCHMHYMRGRRAGEFYREAQTNEQYIRERVREDANGCWIWTLAVNKGGYGVCNSGRGSKFAHRLSWMTFHERRVPTGMQVNHTCNVPNCLNPSHLYIGTQQDNVDDMMRAERNRQPRGERCGAAKLCEQSVREILRSTASVRRLQRQYGVSYSLIRAIRMRLIWRHVSA